MDIDNDGDVDFLDFIKLIAKLFGEKQTFLGNISHI